MIFPDINRYLNTIKFTLLNDIFIDSITRYLLAYLSILISCLSSISGDLIFFFLLEPLNILALALPKWEKTKQRSHSSNWVGVYRTIVSDCLRLFAIVAMIAHEEPERTTVQSKFK